MRVPGVQRHREECTAAVSGFVIVVDEPAADYTQGRLADLIGVGQNRISQMEHGQIVTARVETLRKYVEATGGELEVVGAQG